MFVLVFLCIVVHVLLYIPEIDAQDPTPLFTPFPTPVEDLWPFPTGIFCADVEAGPGPTWWGIEIGTSSIAELEALLNSYSDNYRIDNRGDRGTLFSIWDRREAIDRGIPSSVLACLQENVIVALRINMAEEVPSIYFDDLIAELGVPDAVTWGSSAFDRTVFWFEDGMAVSVLIVEPFGAILAPVFFPYQPIDEYEDRWPYNRTYISYIYPHERINPTPSMKRNPFDLPSMLATISAEPTRTPTPTFAPPTSPPNGTSTP